MRKTWLALAFLAAFLAILAVLSPAAHACATGEDPIYHYLTNVRAACAPGTGDCLAAFEHQHGQSFLTSLNGVVVGRTRKPAVIDATWNCAAALLIPLLAIALALRASRRASARH